jgi:hypothetical protein
MDRKDFLKSACGLGICSCAGVSLLTDYKLSAAVIENTDTDKKTPLVPVDLRQIQNVLSYIDSLTDESMKKNIFEKLGAEHVAHEGFKNWINENKKNIKGYFDWINSNKDNYWEKIEYDPVASTVKITGKPVDRCACPYAQPEKPTFSLCNYCCIGFQKAMFEALLDKPVIKVQIDESYLLGGNRCSSTMFIDGKLQVEKG